MTGNTPLVLIGSVELRRGICKSGIRTLKFAIILGVIFFALECPADAQTRPARIGVLGAPEEPRFSGIVSGLKQGLRDLGYAEQALEILEGRVERGKEKDRERSVVEELARKNAQVLFIMGSRLVRRARQVAPTIPIVFITPGDPVASGHVSSLSKPGNNTTALTFEYPELSGKRLEILKEMVPRIRRVLAIYDPRDASPLQGLTAARETAPKLGITLLDRETRSREDIGRALEMLGKVDGFLGIPGGIPTGHYQAIIRAANTKRTATIFHAHSGSTFEALASYGSSDTGIAREAARLIDKILKGANAGELPVERPTKLELVINLKTAKQIGVTIPPNVLARADKVIK
ncbi:MAG: ABC transporter substrate-binding protein [Deltaproteobacteria bacterium]|nr:ABC transporter substrate-binding protein [Deltaproteobacteria bacterium]